MKQPNRTQGTMECWVKQAYSVFLRAYPTTFRRTFADEMAEVFADQVNEAAKRGKAPLLYLAAREFRHTTGAILYAYWFNRNRYCVFFWGIIVQFIKGILSPQPDIPDGRTSWSQTALEVVLFLILGAGLIITTYILDPAWKPLLELWSALILSIPLLWLLVGLARGMPRWAYPSLGVLLGYCFISSLATGTGALFIIFLLIALALLVWAYRVNGKRPFLPNPFRTWRQSLSTDITRLSFSGYGFLTMAIMVAFDNAYANNRTAWLFTSVLCMLGGAVGYSRSRKPAMQIGSLAVGATLSLLAALLDHARFAALQWLDPIWIFSLWRNMLILILLPPVAIRILRFLQMHTARSHPSAGG